MGFFPAKMTIITIITSVVLSCGGGGGNDGSTDSNQLVTLSWSNPNTRENGLALSPGEIQGCVIFYFGESDVGEHQQVAWMRAFSLEDFYLNDSEIGHFVLPDDIPQIIASGTPNAILISSPDQTTYSVGNLVADTYYFAVSCFDWGNLYSRLSSTVSATIDTD
jgi:hypothetical protein